MTKWRKGKIPVSLDVPYDILEPNEKGLSYFVIGCNLLGITAQGKTEQEAVDNLKESINLLIEDLETDGE